MLFLRLVIPPYLQVSKYEAQLKSDDLIAHHLELLYDKMLEANLLKIIHPYRYVKQ